VIEEAAAAVRQGEVVGVPTDTVYGIGVDPVDFDAVEKLFDLKGRPAGKPVGVLVSDIEQALQLVDLSDEARELAVRCWPGALTLVARPKVVMANWVGDQQRGTIGVRVPDHEVARDLLARVGPMAVTSANRSGGDEAMDHREANAIFGDEVAVYIEGRAPGGAASTVVDTTGVELVVLREGPIRI
jgi:tRNA threonylcarbamoyl adenosine modification protein (Sua5/YciO/YrdC/YwlC family)